jgi:methyl-accepting chemotaxis protein
MSIKTKLISTCIFIAVGIIFLLVSLKLSTERIKINGPVYKEIISGKDLIADILPPPEYIIESYLVVLQALAEKDISKIPSFQERFKQLRSDYDDRQNYWGKELPSGKIKSLLLEESHKPAVTFFDTAAKEYFPALTEGNHAKAEKILYDNLLPSYEEHRKVIDEIVTLCNTENTVIEKRSADLLNNSNIAILTISLIFFAIVIAIFYFIIRSISSQLRKALSIANIIADGDLSVKVQETSKDEIGQLLETMNTMTDNLRTIICQVTDSSTQVASAANTLHYTAEQIATSAEEVTAQTGTVAAASEEMAVTSKEIAHNCTLVAAASQQSTESANAGAQVVQETIKGMANIAERVRQTARTVESLGTRSEQIGNIVGTIEDIADQTNLLALNAAIEAARAGDQGRGFAVVADEVRALAERTTRATKEIGEMIKTIQTETKGAVQAIEEGVHEAEKGAESAQRSGEALHEILARINEVAMQVSQIATTAEQQTATTNEVTNNIQQITEVVQQSARGADETTSAAAQLAQQASDLQSLVSRFKTAA